METQMINEPTKSQKFWREVVDWTESILISFCIAAFVLIYIFRIVVVDGSSMVPTLHDQEKLIALSTFYSVDVGDIVVVKRDGNSPIVKRVIARGGQEVEIDFEKGHVYVDGQLLDEYYINAPTKTGADSGIEYPLIVPEDCYFVMGDNRNESLDSRYQEIGMIREDHIFGEVVFRLSPFSQIGFVL